MKSYKVTDITFVSIQLLFIGLYFIAFFDFSITLNLIVKYIALLFSIIGLLIIVIAILQLNKNLTPFPTPKEDGTLISNGLYKYVRHPIYSGIIISAIAFGIYFGSIWKVSFGILLWVLFFFKSKYEEKMLMKHFLDYKFYMKTTKRFFPFI